MEDPVADEPADEPADERRDVPEERPWPHARGRRSSVLAQFGRARADLVQWALTTGDPLADAVVTEVHEGGAPVRAALARGVRHGLSSLADPPPAVADLLRQTESRPEGVGDDLLDRGSRPYFNVPNAVHIVSLSAGALIRVYESPSIAQVLASTGRLVEGAEKRIRETGTWVTGAMFPGALRVGEVGYVSTLQVRMLHAHVRAAVRGRGYDEAAYGVAINQADLARTWMDFTLTAYRAEEVMGFERTTAELASLYRYWWQVAHLLGVDARLVAGITTHEQAARVDDLLQAVTGTASPASSQLAHASIRSIAGELQTALRLPERAGRSLLHALTRRIQGDRLGDELLLPRPRAAGALLEPATRLVREHRRRARRDAVAWEAAIDEHLAEARRLVGQPAEPSTYQRQDDPAETVTH